MKHKQRIGQLQNGVRSILAKNGYTFTEEDKAILENILVELEEMLNTPEDISPKDNSIEGNKPYKLLQIISLLLKFLKFFGIDNFTDLL
ncbi:hypothetical protein [Flavobacterium sp. '19STA2R22 D10 B1']|uniref:hypothetical protein n=1 Tax=Flavobacterium aerium TaxID=3037261 RepID=UPI00278BCE35|nr:hypothetical protein [Flavobacterium sp. '19STA2R22 D10 B1']